MALHDLRGRPVDHWRSRCCRCARDDLGRLLCGLFRTRPGFRACERPPSGHDTRSVTGGFSRGDSHPLGARGGRRCRDPGWRVGRRARQARIRAGRQQDPPARSLVGMVVRAGAAKPDISSVEAFRKALLAAKSIAYSDSASGIYLSTTLFAKLGVAEQLAGKTQKVRGPPSGEPVAAVVVRGEAEIGFQQVSELINVPGVTFVGTIPAELQPDVSFAGALTRTARQPEAARALIRFLASPDAAATIRKAGLTPVSGR